MAIKSLDSAKKNKNDEFYTRFDEGIKTIRNILKGKSYIATVTTLQKVRSLISSN